MNQLPEHQLDTTTPKEEEVSLLDYVMVVVKYLKLILGLIGVTVVTTIISLLVMTPTYTATTTILPTAGGGNPLLDAAGLLGLSTGRTISEGSPQYFSAILTSRTFLNRVVQRRFKTEASPDSVTLSELFGGKNSPQVIEAAIGNFRGRMKIGIDSKTGIMTISTEASDPRLAADIANTVVEELIVYNQQVRTSRAKEARLFIEKRLAETEVALNNAEEIVKIFRERNRDIGLSPELQLIQERLTREVSVQQEIFLTLKRQYETVKIDELKETPVVNILDRAISPLRKTKPRPKKAVLLAGIVGAFAGVFLAFAFSYVEHLKNDERSAEKLVAISDQMKRQFRYRL